MRQKRKVLITGGSGYIASQLLNEFRKKYEVSLIDVVKRNRSNMLVDGVVIADLLDADRSKYEHLFCGVDTVVHLGYKRPPSVPLIEQFDVELDNVRIANNVYRTAYDMGVKRVVVASSNHAADWYEHELIHTRKKEMVSPDELPLSDNFYGWAKASYELLGYPYACGIFGRKLEIVQIRIGAPRDVAGTKYMGDLSERHGSGSGISNFKRDLGAHISERDLRQLVTRSIETDDISNKHGVPWLVVYGISGNTRRFWSLESARKILEYEPEDDTEVKYAADIQRFITGDKSSAFIDRVGE